MEWRKESWEVYAGGKLKNISIFYVFSKLREIGLGSQGNQFQG